MKPAHALSPALALGVAAGGIGLFSIMDAFMKSLVIAIGVYNDGFIHAGNLAYLSIMALFPFFILAAAIANILGQTESGAMTVATILSQLPPDVAETLRAPVREVLTARTGPLLWLGAAVGASRAEDQAKRL